MTGVVVAPLLPAVQIGAAMPPELAARLRLVVVAAELNLPAVATFEFDDPWADAAAGWTIGAPVTVRYGDTTLFTGELTGVESRYDGTGQTTLAVAHDVGYRLQLAQRTTAHVQQSYAEIVRAVASAAGVPAGTIDMPSGVVPFVAQVAEDGWSFLLRLADATGCDVAVRDGALCVAPRPAPSGAPAAQLTDDDPRALHPANGQVIRLHVAARANRQFAGAAVRGWDPTTKQVVVATAAAPATPPGAAPAGISPAPVTGATAYTLAEPAVATTAVADLLASSAADRVAGSLVELEAELHGAPSLAPGIAVGLAGVAAPLCGSYTLTAVRHVFDWETGYRTFVEVRDRPWFAERVRGPGVVPGVVVDNDDSDGSLGRVKVRFDWLDDTYVTDWARVVQFGAGAQRGSQVVPEVGDEVLVGFAADDFAAPYVIGGLYNGADAPKVAWSEVVAGGAVTQRVFVSRTGHTVAFVDEPGEKGAVRIATGDGKTTVELTQGQVGVSVTTANAVSLTATGKVTVDADAAVSVSSKQAVSVEAASSLTLKGAAVTVEATGQLELKGATVTLSAQGPVNVSGTPIRLN